MLESPIDFDPFSAPSLALASLYVLVSQFILYFVLFFPDDSKGTTILAPSAVLSLFFSTVLNAKNNRIQFKKNEKENT